MIKTTSPLFLLSVALLASICHHTFSLETWIPTRHEQCQMKYTAGSCEYVNEKGIREVDCHRLICAVLLGFNHLGKRVYLDYDRGPPAEGTRCGPNSYCLQEECVKSEEEYKKIQYTGPETKIAECN